MTDWKFHFSFNTDGTTKYIKLPAVNLNADVVQERLHSPEITTNYVEKELPGNDSLVALIHYITESSMLMPTVTHVGKGGLPAGVGDLKAESAHSFPPAPAATNAQKVPAAGRDVAVPTHVHHGHRLGGILNAPVSEEPMPLYTATQVDDNDAPNDTAGIHVHSPRSHSDYAHLPSISLNNQLFKKKLSPVFESVWQGIKSSKDISQSNEPTMELTYKVVDSRVLASFSDEKPVNEILITFTRRKVVQKDVFTRSFILRTSPIVERPPSIASSSTAPSTDASDVVSSSDISSGVILSSGTTFQWSNLAMSRYIRIWVWNQDLREWQPIGYGGTRRISRYTLALGFYRNTFEPLWVTPESLRKRDSRSAKLTLKICSKAKSRSRKSRFKPKSKPGLVKPDI
ncbi:hypothetical protein F5876DRAFT_69135 [Lentinula aff. lateritia]|uniref:Uncharacterized protein n=1 Tax=Lentinula aff. lateritia TaxID=2804960 RepID=A0ACC1TNT9_9AGAR|nr:hypothetical protein F5876DRAFT_69135 [Lentinula aff. lateritia]